MRISYPKNSMNEGVKTWNSGKKFKWPIFVWSANKSDVFLKIVPKIAVENPFKPLPKIPYLKFPKLRCSSLIKKVKLSATVADSEEK